MVGDRILTINSEDATKLPQQKLMDIVASGLCMAALLAWGQHQHYPIYYSTTSKYSIVYGYCWLRMFPGGTQF